MIYSLLVLDLFASLATSAPEVLPVFGSLWLSEGDAPHSTAGVIAALLGALILGLVWGHLEHRYSSKNKDNRPIGDEELLAASRCRCDCAHCRGLPLK